MSKVLMFDVDGVLADFGGAFTFLANKMFGTPIRSAVNQKEWNFRSVLTNKEQSAVWHNLKNYPHWWEILAPLVDREVMGQINSLCLTNEVYFITNRTHNLTPPGVQTQRWLQENGINHSPRVVVTANKGEACKVMKVDYALEDNWGNACAIHWMSDTKSFLINRHYNKEARGIIPEGITRVETVLEFIEAIERGNNYGRKT